MNPVTLSKWGGRLLLAIAVLHIAVFLPHPYWSEWLAGDLRGGSDATESIAVFWALPGGFAVVGILLALLIGRLAKSGQVAPAYVGWTLLAWATGCVAIVGVSGFVLGIVPSLMLVVASLMDRKRGPARAA